MIHFENVTVMTPDKRPVVQGVSFSVPAQEKCALIGPSGCGKSTILRAAVAGLEQWSGTIKINGMVLTPKTVQNIRSTVGYIGQEPRLPETTVETYLSTFLTAAKTGWNQSVRQRVIKLCLQLNLSDRILRQNCRDLSGGERQRIAIVAVLLLDRPFILADEITSALDQKATEAVMDLLFSSERTILSVSHESPWIERCDRTIDVTAFTGVQQ